MLLTHKLRSHNSIMSFFFFDEGRSKLIILGVELRVFLSDG